MDQPLSITITRVPPTTHPDIESVVFNVSYERVPPTEAQRHAMETDGFYTFGSENLPRSACCQLQMKNGWQAVGYGPVRAPADYDAAVEERAAYADAWTQIQRRLDLQDKRSRAAQLAAEIAADPVLAHHLALELLERRIAPEVEMVTDALSTMNFSAIDVPGGILTGRD